jgi:phosphate regulon transcriptional regulator PhoB
VLATYAAIRLGLAVGDAFNKPKPPHSKLDGLEYCSEHGPRRLSHEALWEQAAPIACSIIWRAPPNGRVPALRRVLIIEDDRDIVELVRYNLASEGFEVGSSPDGLSGLAQIRKSPPDVLLLDLMLPKMPGLEVCREIRRDPSLNRLPILMLTARGEEADRVVGLEMGADDYVTKPFSPRELVARVRALLRRTSTAEEADHPIEVGNLLIDPSAYRVTRAGVPVTLSTLEFRLLHHLASRPNRVFTRDQLLDAVWGTERFVTPRSVDVYVRRLREKIEDDPDHPAHLKTVRGAGYLFDSGRGTAAG